ncbi:MAG: hypothetical protein KJO98_10535 [Rhodothermia bacterium]|nr:hypothetical protein [Rhodothermia bacterium]
MGQQQLLLLVISIIVVAFAIMAGFSAAQTKLMQSEADTLISRNLSIASEAVFWKTKRDPYAGGNASYAGLATDGMQKLFLGEATHNGTFKITLATTNELQITAVSTNYPEIGARTFIRDYSIDSTAVAYDGSITIE